MARLGREHFDDVSAEGDDIRARRERLGVDALDLASAAGIHRNTLSALEKGSSYNASTLSKVLRALEAMEEEAGIGAPSAADVPAAPTEPHIIVVRLKNDVGEVAVEGPVDDLAELEAAARRLLRGLREDQ